MLHEKATHYYETTMLLGIFKWLIEIPYDRIYVRIARKLLKCKTIFKHIIQKSDKYFN